MSTTAAPTSVLRPKIVIPGTNQGIITGSVLPLLADLKVNDNLEVDITVNKEALLASLGDDQTGRPFDLAKVSREITALPDRLSGKVSLVRPKHDHTVDDFQLIHISSKEDERFKVEYKIDPTAVFESVTWKAQKVFLGTIRPEKVDVLLGFVHAKRLSGGPHGISNDSLMDYRNFLVTGQAS